MWANRISCGSGDDAMFLSRLERKRKRNRLGAVLRRLYDATWGRLFAAVYDRILARGEERRACAISAATTLAPATGRTLEIGAGTGLNHDLYPAAVTELVMTEPFGPMADQLREKRRRARRRPRSSRRRATPSRCPTTASTP